MEGYAGGGNDAGSHAGGRASGIDGALMRHRRGIYGGTRGRMRIELRDITKEFAGRQVIHGVTLAVPDGCFATLLGPSGCGKTTLLRMVAGLEEPTSGEILFDGKPVFSRARGVNVPPERRGLGFVFQDFALWPHMTVFENVAFGLRAARRTEGLDARVRDALRAVHLEDFAGRYPHQLSGGQQQRVAFARAIACEPACILFDEPLSALDARLREQMRVELKELVARLGITALFVTHDQGEAMSMSDRIAVVNAGRIEQYGTPEEVYDAPASVFVAQFVGSSNWIDDRRMFRPERAVVCLGGEGASDREGVTAGSGSRGTAVAAGGPGGTTAGDRPERAAGTSDREGTTAGSDRPEGATPADAERFEAAAVSSEFLGGSYRVHLMHDGRDWRLPSPRRVPPGTPVSVYVRRADIVALPG